MKPNVTSLIHRRTFRPAAALALLLCAAGAAHAQVSDTQLPLNYNFHGYGQSGEAVAAATNGNADLINFRSIADRGLYWNPSDTHAWGTNPIIGTTGITYSLFDVLGYGNTTTAGAATYIFDSVHLGSRVFNRGMETAANASTSTGNATGWAPIFNVTSLSSDGTTISGTTDVTHGLSIGQRVNIAGANPVGFSGAFTVATASGSSFTLTPVSPGTVPAAGAATGSIFCNSTSTPLITALSGSGSIVTATTSWIHGFTATTNSVNITGASDPAFNGLFPIATVNTPNTQTFTYAAAASGSPTGNQIYLATCDHTTPQTTVLASPVTLDANTEIGVLYTISDSGGKFEVVLNFTDATSESVWVGGADWVGSTVPPIISNKVSATGVIKHTVSGTTSLNFRAVSNNDTASLNAFGTGNIEVGESIISVPKFTAAGVNIVGKTLSSVTFRNAFFNPTQITALTVSGGVATATVSSNAGFIPGMPIRISGVLSNNAGNVREYDGDARIDSLNGTTQFRFLTSATGTASAKMFATTAGGGTVQVNTLTTSGTFPTATATITTAAAHGFAVGDVVTIEGSSVGLENGSFTINTVPTATTFTVTPGATGTATAQMQVTRAGFGRGYQVHAMTVRTGAAVNASCASPISLPPSNPTGISVSGTNSHAVASVPATSACGTNDTTAVYYTYTAIGSNPITIATCGTFANSVAVLSGTCGALSPVACNASNTANCGGASGNSASSLTFAATGGTTYFIRISGQNGAMGNFTLSLQEFTNSSCAGAVSVTAGSTAGSTIANAGGGTTPCGGNDTNAVWYMYTATGVGAHTVEARTCLDGQAATSAWTPNSLVSGVTGVRPNTCASSTLIYPLDTTIAIYNLSDCGMPSPTPIACNDNGCSVSSRVQWTATAGTTYLIRVASKASGYPGTGSPASGPTGPFVLQIDDPVHTDLPLPLQFNWNGICHGTAASAGPNFFSEQNVTTPQAHENRTDLNGYRSISDRGLLFDPNNATPNAFNYGGTIGYQGLQYQVYATPLQMDLVHVSQAAAPYRGYNATTAPFGNFKPTSQTWASPTTANPSEGYLPAWLAGTPSTGAAAYDHTIVTSSMTGLAATFGPNTKLGLIYNMTNLSAAVGSFRVTLNFSDGFIAQVTCNATDWFGGTSAVPCGAALPGTFPSGVETHRVLGVYNAVQDVDRANPAASGQLKVVETIISRDSLNTAGMNPEGHGTLTSIVFDNVTSTDAASNLELFAATLRDPASFTLNYPPSGTGTVTPNQLNAGGTGKMTVSVSRGTPPNNAISTVIVNATDIGLSPNFALNDSGVGGDTTANDNIWSANVSFPINAVPNAYSLPFTVTDSQGRTAMGNIIFSVVAPTGSLTPSTGVIAGVTSVHASFVFGNPGGIASVVLDGVNIGLGNINLNDSGTGGDTASNDGTWGGNFIPSSSLAPGTYDVPYVITDTGSNTASGTLQLTIIPPPPANDDCAGAIALTLSTAYNGDNTQATSNDGAAAAVCPTLNPTNVTKAVWFSFTPGTTGDYLVSACGTARDTVMTVFNGGVDCTGIGSASNILVCQDDNGPGCTGTAASVVATMTSGTTYLIRHSDYSTASAGGAYTVIVTPYITGACCNNSTGACTTVASTACSATTSTFQGDGTTCATPCAVVGVCCNNTTGACTSIYGGACPTGTTGAPGGGTTCDVNTCPPSGTCCTNATGACAPTFSLSCPSTATFNASLTCSPNPCAVAGSCCNNTSGACTFIYGGACPANTSAGVNLACDTSTCPPIGSCCDNVTGACSLLYGGIGCVGNATFNSSTTCGPSTCPQLQWACCFADGSCLSLFQFDCTGHSGAVWAAGQTCGTYVCPSCTNVLANPGAETGDMSGWIVDANGGNGWGIVDVSGGQVHTGNKAFATSYALCRRHQLIDLTQFFSAAQLDAAPDISAGEYVHTRGDQGGQYYVLIQLLAADQTTVIATYNDGTQAALTQLPQGTPYTLVSNTFTGYGPGVRYLRFEDGGRDVNTWAGNYGTHFDDAFAGPTTTTAACCGSSGCSVISNADCITAGGTPQACGTTCSPSPCGGVCCRGSTCNSAVAQAACTTTGALAGAFFSTSASTCNAANNTTSPCCFPDYNKQGGITVGDIFDFLNDWFAGQKFAIVGGDGSHGTLQVQNIFDFLNAWFAGGC